MHTVSLGTDGPPVTKIGLGCWQFSGGVGGAGSYWPALPEEETNAIVSAALAGGINWFDTAESYGRGRSELALAQALRHAGVENGQVLIATKWLPWGRRARSITNTIDERLRCLSPFEIDLHQIHTPLGAFATEAAKMRAMADLVERGKIRLVGVSNYSAARTRQCGDLLQQRGVRLAANQVKYSLLDRRIESNGVLEAARAVGATIIAYSPLHQGLLSGKFHDDPSLIRSRPGPRRFSRGFRPRGLERSRPVIEALRQIATDHGATPSQVALHWLVSFHGDAVVAIPGATKTRHVEDNVGAMALELTPAELARIDEVSRPFL